MRGPKRLLTLGIMATALVAAGPVKFIDPANLDPTVRPCEDFYRFANGGWVKANPVPADKARWGSFEQLADRNREVIQGIFQELSRRKDLPPGSLSRKIADFYASGMDEAAIEKAGTTPLKPVLARIGGLRDAGDLPRLLGELRLDGQAVGFGFLVNQDPRQSTRYIGILNQGGLGMPDRDYYLKDDSKSVEIRARYLAHIQRMLELAGAKAADAAAEAATVLDLETRLAQASLTRVENRDPQKTYNKTTLAGLEKAAPGFAWGAYFAALGVKDPGDLNVRQPGFFKAFAGLAATVPADRWRTYLRWHAVSAAAPGLTRAFQEEAFAFHGTVLNGQPRQEERWKRVQAAADRVLGEAIGQLFVEKVFSAPAKARMVALVENLRAALRERIEGLDWMGPETKAQALRKLAAFGVKVGYPDTWRDYAGLEVTRDSYAENLRRGRRFETARNLARLGRPINRGEWGMTPQTVNAYYSPTMNEIVFPAGILQPPFFDLAADDGAIYGGIGAVIGHEMSHGFDDSGSQYDADGNLKNWWTDADRANYKSRTDLIVRQFDGYEVLPGLRVNGRLTLGENIGDLGGLKIAFAGLQKALAGRDRASIDGFTPEQRFFLNWAQVWRNSIRDEALRVRVNTDSHAPGVQRVVGPLSNLPEFHQAFGCAVGSPMLRPAADRPAIW